ncbi:MAG: biotin/lipoyl-binding protein, partial [Prevotella sp.]|nr:biotin/lipoyl-binding protein [Prevotella sp.]
MKKTIITICAMLTLSACANKEKEYDATGTFEATEVTVYAKQSGTLQYLNVNEGDIVNEGQEIGLIDTTETWLKIKQLAASKKVYQSQKPDIEKQIAATRQQLVKAQTEQRRYRQLVADGAAPSKQLDDANTQVQILKRQLDAQISTLTART